MIVLSGSLGTTLEMWQPQVTALAKRHRVLRIDHRGHGASPVPPGPYTIDDLGRDVLGLVDSLDIRQVSFAGLSLGGVVGIWLAANAPERVRALAVCCSAAYLGPPEGWTQRAALVREKGPGAVADAVMERFFSPGFREQHPDVVASYREDLAGMSPEGYAGCCEAIASLDERGRLGAIIAETVVLTGAEDVVIPRERIEELLDGIPSATERPVPDAGHMASVEQPDAVTRILLEHLGG